VFLACPSSMMFQSVLSALASIVKKAPAVADAAPQALHPLTYLPFHLVGHHLTARLFPYKRITYPAHLIFAVSQYCVEHYSAEFPSVAALGPALVGIALSMAPYIYYRAFKTTEGPKALVWAALASFLPILFVFKGLELGFPKDTPEEQAVANLDRAHSLWHLLLHVLLLGNQLLVSCGVPWSPKADQPAALVPPSPALSTRRSVRGFALTEDPCSPGSINKKRAFGSWAAKAKTS